MKTRYIVSTLAACALCASAAFGQTATPDTPAFPDVPRGHWAFDAVQKLAALGIIEGRPSSPARAAAPRVSAAPATMPDSVTESKTLLIKTGAKSYVMVRNARITQWEQAKMTKLEGTVRSQRERTAITAQFQHKGKRFINAVRVAAR